MAEKQLDKGEEKQLDKGNEKQLDKGGAEGAVEDVFRRVSGLGGLLIVAFVAPVAGRQAGSAPRPLDRVAAEAKARYEELVQAAIVPKAKPDKP